MSAACKGKQWACALDVLEQACEAPLRLDVVSYNVAISSCASGLHWRLALDLLRGMPEATVRRDVVTYNAALSACGDAVKVVWPLLRQMRMELLKPDIVSFGSAVAAASSSRQWDSALSLLQAMGHASVRPDVAAVSAGASAVERSTMWTVSLQLLHRAHGAGLKLDSKANSMTVQAHLQGLAWENSLCTLLQMRVAGQEDKPELASVSSVLALEGLWQRGASILRSLQQEGQEPDLVTYSTVLGASRAGRWQRVAASLQALRADGFVPDKVAYNAVSSAFATGERWDCSLGMLKGMRAAVLRPNTVSYNTVMSSLATETGEHWSYVLALWQELSADGLREQSEGCAQPWDVTSWACEVASVPALSPSLRSCQQHAGSWSALAAGSRHPTQGSAMVIGVGGALRIRRGTKTSARLPPPAHLQHAGSPVARTSCRRAQTHKAGPRESAQGGACQNQLRGTKDYTSLIRDLGRERRWREAIGGLARLRQSLQVGTIACNAAITACKTGQQWEQAVGMLSLSHAWRVCPDTVTFNALISACQRGQLWQKPLHLLDEMPRLALGADLISYNSAIAACSAGGKWQHAILMHQAAVLAEVSPDAVTYTALLQALDQGSWWQKAFSTLQEARRTTGLRLDTVLFNGVMSAACKGKQWACALDVLEQACEAPLRLDVVSYNVAISSCASGLHWRLALDLLRGMPEATVRRDVVTYNAALSACGDAVKVVWPLLRQMRMELLKPDIVSFGSAVAAASSSRQWDSALSLLQAMGHASVRPDVAAVSAGASAVERSTMWTVSLQLLHRAHGAGLKLDSKANSMTVQAHLQGLAWENSLCLLLQMRVAGQDDKLDLASVSSVLALEGLWQRGASILRSLQQEGQEPDLVTYSTVLGASRAGRWQRVAASLQALRADGFVPDKVAYNAVSSAFATGERWDCSLGMLKGMRAAVLRPNTVSYNAVMSSLATETGEHWSYVLALWQELSADGLRLSLPSYGAAMRSTVAGWQWERAVCLWSSLRDVGGLGQPSLMAWIAMLSACEKGERWQEAVNLLETLHGSGLEACAPVRSVVISACEKARKWQHALCLLGTLRMAAVELNTISFNAGISAAEKGRQWGWSLLLLEAMRSAGVETDVVTYSASISAAEKGDVWQVTLMLLADMMEVRNLAPSPQGFNAAVLACARCGVWEQMVQLLDQMQALSVEPDSTSQSALIMEFEQRGLMGSEQEVLVTSSGQGAQRVSAEVRATESGRGTVPRGAGHGLAFVPGPPVLWKLFRGDARTVTQQRAQAIPGRAPNRNGWQHNLAHLGEKSGHSGKSACRSIIFACERADAWHAALALLSRARATVGFEPDAASVSAAISACGGKQQAKAGLWQRVLNLLQGTCAWRLELDVVTSSAAVSACSQAGKWQTSLVCARWAASEGIRGDVVFCNAVLTACSRAGEWQRAFSLLRNFGISTAGQESPRLDLVSFNAAASACERSGEWRLALALYSELPTQGLSPGEFTLSTCISACARRARWQLALGLLRCAKQARLEPGLFSHNAFLNACDRAGQWKEALASLGQLRTDGLSPDPITCNAAMSSCDKAKGQWWRTLQLLSSMQLWALRPTAVSFKVVASVGAESSCACAVSWQDALALLAGAEIGGTDAVAIDAAVSSLERAGRFELAPCFLEGLPIFGFSQGKGRRRGSPTRFLEDTSVEAVHAVVAIDLLAWHGRADCFAVAAFDREVQLPAQAGLQDLLRSPPKLLCRGDGGSSLLRDGRLELGPMLGQLHTIAVLRQFSLALRHSNGWIPDGCRRVRAGLLLSGARFGEEPAAKSLAVWAAHCIRSRGPDLGRGRSSGHVVGLVSDAVQAGLALWPVHVQHDRAPHGERQALLAILDAAAGGHIEVI
ncbi:unnamed protein product [Polarella glacialis]|uniref:Pentatricopeptide repeat-containing protein, chloroplastic n=1 Tax=Polarella glacialis TaxID=89957 RepID=A0A813DCA6_POLGL|nr:unnamed protein product [Polarella glacialis]